jgi:hypothetical protein
MALELIVDSLDNVPEAARGAYVKQNDGRFKLDFEVEDTAGLKSALKKERDAAATAAKELAKWKSSGKTADEIAELLEAQRKKDEDDAKKSGNFDAILKQHQDKAAKEKADLESELNAARASERSAVVGERVLGALTKAGATPEGLELLPDRLTNRIKVETVDGRRVIKVMQADGETPMAGSNADGTASIDDLVKEVVAKFPSQFKGTGAGGGGKLPNESGGGGSGPKTYAECTTDEQKVAFLKAKREAKG